MFDTHCHLTFFENTDEVISKAKEAGLTGLLSLSTNPTNFQTNLDLKGKYPDFVKIGIGIHPEDVELEIQDEGLKMEISSLGNVSSKAGRNWFLQRFLEINHSEIDVIGEIGLDYFHKVDNISAQKEMFEMQLDIAQSHDKSVVVHSRNNKDSSFQSCIKDAVEILNKYKVKAVCHCFTGNLEEAKLVLESGYFIGFTNIVTYPKNVEFRSVANFAIENFPNQILFETDAPYLPPAQRRGEKCFPADVKYVYEMFEEKIDKFKIQENIKGFFHY